MRLWLIMLTVALLAAIEGSLRCYCAALQLEGGRSNSVLVCRTLCAVVCHEPQSRPCYMQARNTPHATTTKPSMQLKGSPCLTHPSKLLIGTLRVRCQPSCVTTCLSVLLAAACDPGGVGVFASVFYLPPPRALNWLINEQFRHPTLVLQVG